jgi:hypothetical protein
VSFMAGTASLLSPVSYIRPGRTTARLARRRAGRCSSPRSAASAT